MRSSTLGIVIAALIMSAAFAAWLMWAYMQPEPVEPPAPVVQQLESPRAIGTSVRGRTIELYTFGTGSTELLFVGGIHGGYEWNSVALAYEFIDLFTATPDLIPASTTVRIIPSLNPDGVYAATALEGKFSAADIPVDVLTDGTGRFNANDVDLNRNFDCKWQPESTWRSKEVSAGAAPFSEPEAQALKRVVMQYRPDAAIFWHSQADAVYGSACEGDILPGTYKLLAAYARAADYREVEYFDAYEVTGAAEDWLAAIGIPAITVELSTHESLDWERNLAGIQAVLEIAWE